MIEQTENRLTVAEAQNICLRNNIPFYTYRLPGSREVIFGAQLSNDTRIFKGFEKHRGEKGFVITPFNHSSWSFPFFIKADLSFTDYLIDGRGSDPEFTEHRFQHPGTHFHQTGLRALRVLG